jgi:hypothetical protein
MLTRKIQVMKTQIVRGGLLVALGTALWCCTGCSEDEASAQEVTPAGAAQPAIDTATGADTSPLVSPAIENSDNPTNAPEPKLVMPAEPPESLKISPNLKEIVKLVQSGVSEPVVLTYITNSNQPFNLGADEIVYLNDIGVSSQVLAALIHHETLPAIVDKKRIAGTTEPLPSGVGLTTPAPNVYTTPAPAAAPAPSVAVTPPLTPPADVAQPPAEPASLDYFYNSLSPYGSWVDVAGYGLCWQPTVAVANPGWYPYRDRGRWLWTDSGWYWYSDYSWGWAPFHYGRWCTYPRLGWIWVPDRVWGPSWVSWRYSHDYCGWAPLPPRCYAVSGFGLWFGGGAVSVGFDFGLPFHHYSFVPLHRIGDRNPGLHVVRGDRVRNVYNNSTVINNYIVNNGTVVNQGMGRDRIASMTKAQIPTARLVDARPVQGRPGLRAERIEGSGSSLVVTRPHAPVETAPAAKPPRQERVAFSGNRNDNVGSSRVASGVGSVPRVMPSQVAPPAKVTSAVNLASRSEITATTRPPVTRSETASPRPERPNGFPSRNFADRGTPSVPSVRDATPAKPVTPLPPVNKNAVPSTSIANRNPESLESIRQRAPQGSIIIGRDNANNNSTTISRPVGAPSTRSQQVPSWNNNSGDGSAARPSIVTPPAIPNSRIDSPRANSFRSENSQLSAPPVRPQPANPYIRQQPSGPSIAPQPAAPAMRSQPSAPPTRSESPRSYSAPAPSSPSAPSGGSSRGAAIGGGEATSRGSAVGGGAYSGRRGRGDH